MYALGLLKNATDRTALCKLLQSGLSKSYCLKWWATEQYINVLSMLLSTDLCSQRLGVVVERIVKVNVVRLAEGVLSFVRILLGLQSGKRHAGIRTLQADASKVAFGEFLIY